MAMMAANSSGSRYVSYSTSVVTRSYTLGEAIEKAARGELDPEDVYDKSPEEFRGVIDQLSVAGYARRFRALNLDERCKLMRQLSDAIAEASASSPREETPRRTGRSERDPSREHRGRRLAVFLLVFVVGITILGVTVPFFH